MPAGVLGEMYRYPVKSMLGEALTAITVSARGLHGDRARAVVDLETGRVASAKEPRRWKRLLECAATGEDGDVRLRIGGEDVAAAEADTRLRALLGRAVALRDVPPPSPELLRSVPEEVLRDGVDAVVGQATVELAAGAPGTFFDYAPIHLITRATLEGIGARHPAGTVLAARYRANLVLELPGPAFAENEWAGRTLRLGDEVVLRVLIATPRCAVPTLDHDGAGRDPDALRVLDRHNRVDLDAFGIAACAGAYATVVAGGRLEVGDAVREARRRRPRSRRRRPSAPR